MNDIVGDKAVEATENVEQDTKAYEHTVEKDMHKCNWRSWWWVLHLRILFLNHSERGRLWTLVNHLQWHL